MMPSRPARIVCAVALLLGMSACVPPQGARYPGGPPPATGGPRFVGTIDGVTGPEAYFVRGGSGAARAYNGLRIFEGDHIYTGRGTRMILRLAQGGEAELDENTDPVPRFLVDLGCLVIDLLRSGQMFVNGSAVCVGAVGTLTKQDSQVVYDVRRGYAQITVAGGRAQLRRPRVQNVPAGWRVDANAREVLNNGRPYQITRAEVEQAVRWTRWYQERRPALPGLTAPGVPGLIEFPKSGTPPGTSPPQTTTPPSPPAQPSAPATQPRPRPLPQLEQSRPIKPPVEAPR